MAPVQPTTSDLQRQAIELGLAALGVCRAEPYVGTEQAIADRSARGLFADLKFTMARPGESCHPESLLTQARSVISGALCYWSPERDVEQPADPARAGARGRIARYTRDDGYQALRSRLETIARQLVDGGFAARVLVDSNHHVDREAAARSGVGFYGKHTNIISRRAGSWIVLGTIVTDAPLEPTEPMRPGCGSCTACIDACPTDAIIEDGVLDTRRCITYWTQSRHDIPGPVREAMVDRVYGCDICQDVCPWNRGVEKRRSGHPHLDGTVSLVDWLTADQEDLLERYERFFIPRRQVKFLRRNALVAMGNVGSDADVPVVVPFLRDPDRMLRTHAAWALERIGTASARHALRQHGPVG